MTNDVFPDEKTIISEALQRLRSSDRHRIPSAKVKLFLQMVGDELKRTGELNRDYVDRLVQQIKSGER